MRYAILAWIALMFALGIVMWSWFSHGIVWTMLITDLEPALKLERIKHFFNSFGLF